MQADRSDTGNSIAEIRHPPRYQERLQSTDSFARCTININLLLDQISRSLARYQSSFLRKNAQNPYLCYGGYSYNHFGWDFACPRCPEGPNGVQHVLALSLYRRGRADQGRSGTEWLGRPSFWERSRFRLFRGEQEFGNCLERSCFQKIHSESAGRDSVHQDDLGRGQERTTGE